MPLPSQGCGIETGLAMFARSQGLALRVVTVPHGMRPEGPVRN